MGRIIDIVNETFDDLDGEATDALAKLDALTDELAQVPDDVFALAVLAMVKAKTDKQNAAEVAAIVKQLLSALVLLI